MNSISDATKKTMISPDPKDSASFEAVWRSPVAGWRFAPPLPLACSARDVPVAGGHGGGPPSKDSCGGGHRAATEEP